jgi:hypothetical protein
MKESDSRKTLYHQGEKKDKTQAKEGWFKAPLQLCYNHSKGARSSAQTQSQARLRSIISIKIL